MSVAVRIPSPQRFILDNISWGRYTRLLRLLEDRHLRLTYDRGVLEIMTLSHEHESDASFLGRLAVTLTEEFDLPIKEGRSTTFRRRRAEKGLEPDNCYWITHEHLVRGKRVIDLRRDPPPDLAIEIDITRSSLDRMGIYAALKVPEVWRYDGRTLKFFRLAGSKYSEIASSGIFSVIKPADLVRFLDMRLHEDENAVIRRFRTWIRELKSGNGKKRTG
jgi:Uma2 family endonuclease